MEKEQISLYEKLAAMRVDLQNEKISKSGMNSYSNFKYYNLDDFLPACNNIAKKHKVFLKFNIDKERAELVAINIENTDEKEVFAIPISEVTVKGANSMQNIGAVTTYARRYLYMIVFEIAESDSFDTEESMKKNEEEERLRKEYEEKQLEMERTPIAEIKVNMIEKELARTGVSEEAVCKRYNVKAINEITEGKFPVVMKSLKATPTKQGFEE